MRTVLVGARPPEFEAWLERRRALGQDRHDEVWEGEYHVAPIAHGRHGMTEVQLAVILHPYAQRVGLRTSAACNIGTEDDHRGPDLAFFLPGKPQLYNATAEIVIEVLSPDDESRHKFGFYHRVGVGEVWLVDPVERTVELSVRDATGYRAATASPRLGISAQELLAAIDWPD